MQGRAAFHELVTQQPRQIVEELAADCLFLGGFLAALLGFLGALGFLFAFSSLYTPKPMELKKLKKMFTPQVTGRESSSPCRKSVISLVRAMPRFWAVSLTSLPVE